MPLTFLLWLTNACKTSDNELVLDDIDGLLRQWMHYLEELNQQNPDGDHQIQQALNDFELESDLMKKFWASFCLKLVQDEAIVERNLASLVIPLLLNASTDQDFQGGTSADLALLQENAWDVASQMTWFLCPDDFEHSLVTVSDFASRTLRMIANIASPREIILFTSNHLEELLSLEFSGHEFWFRKLATGKERISVDLLQTKSPFHFVESMNEFWNKAFDFLGTVSIESQKSPNHSRGFFDEGSLAFMSIPVGSTPRFSQNDDSKRDIPKLSDDKSLSIFDDEIILIQKKPVIEQVLNFYRYLKLSQDLAGKELDTVLQTVGTNFIKPVHRRVLAVNDAMKASDSPGNDMELASDIMRHLTGIKAQQPTKFPQNSINRKLRKRCTSKHELASIFIKSEITKHRYIRALSGPDQGATGSRRGMADDDPEGVNGDHTVRVTLSANYIVERKEKLASEVVSIAKKRPNATARARKDEDFRSFFLVYSFGPSDEPKTAALPPESTLWSATHDLEVTLPYLQNLNGEPFVISIYENVKVETEKAIATRGLREKEDLKINLANNGLTNRQQRKSRFNKAAPESADADDEQQDTVSKSSKSLAADSSKSGNHGHDSIKARESTRKSTQQPTKERSKQPPQRASKAQKSQSNLIHSGELSGHEGEEGQGQKEQPHPHHFDHPERHVKMLQSLSGLRKSRSATSLASLAVLRPKTPPSPHHSTHPLSVLMPRKAKSFVEPVHKKKTTNTAGLGEPVETGHTETKTTIQFDPETAVARASVLALPDGVPSNPTIAPTPSLAPTSPPPPPSLPAQEPTSSSSKQIFATLSDDEDEAASIWTKYGRDSSVNSKSVRMMNNAKSAEHIRTLDLPQTSTAASMSKLTRLAPGPQPRAKRVGSGGTLTVGGSVSAQVLSDPDHSTHSMTKLELQRSQAAIDAGGNRKLSLLQKALLDPETTKIPTRKPGPKDKKKRTRIVIEIHKILVGTVRIDTHDLFRGVSDAFGSESIVPRGSQAVFNTTHIIFTGLMDKRKLLKGLTDSKMEVRVYDRVRQDNLVDSPYGVAMFDLSELLKTSLFLRLCEPILPGVRNVRKSFPPALWVEFGSTLSLRVELHLPLTFQDLPCYRSIFLEKPIGRLAVVLG
ncbi:hypothetical protein HDU76_002673, partial [Blyttiomyces sp. JEL0837]